MSALAIERPPAQLGLEGLAPAPLLQHVKLSLVGVLQRHAEVRIATDGSAHLVVQVLQAKDGLPFVAVHHRPAEHRSDLEHLAAGMTPGTGVLLVGRGIELDNKHGHQVLRLVHCDRVSPVNAADFLTDRQVDQPEA